MKKVSLAIALAGLIPCTGPAAPTAPAASRPDRPPNVVFILADDFGWRDLSCQGSTFYQTPNIDRLATQGVRFTDAYAACPVCSPSRASLVTGQYPARLHLTDYMHKKNAPMSRPTEKLAGPLNIPHLPTNGVTLGEAFKKGGYVTALIGKWHLGDMDPTKFGFDVNIGGCELGHPPSYFSPYKIPTLPDGPKDEYLTDRLTREAVQFIETNREKPFFLYLSHYTVHTPIQARPESVAKWNARAAALPPASGPEFLSEGPAERASTSRQRQDQPVYAAMVESLDDGVGQVLAKLDELGLSQNTIVLFFSDNGGLSTAQGSPTSNAPLRAGKGWMYEGGVREPLIIRWPGVVKAGTTCRAPVISTDLFPTLLEATGLPAEPQQTLDGVSLVPLLRGGTIPERPLFWHYPHYGDQGGRPGGAVRAGDFKLIEWFEGMQVELFNLKDDPSEKHDLAATLPDKAEALREQLHQWRTAVGAVMPTPNPKYNPKAGRGKRGNRAKGG